MCPVNEYRANGMTEGRHGLADTLSLTRSRVFRGFRAPVRTTLGRRVLCMARVTAVRRRGE